MSDPDVNTARKPVKVKPLPLTEVAERLERLDILGAKVAGVAELNKRSLLRVETKLEAQERHLKTINGKIDRVGDMLERFGWVVLGFVILVLLGVVVSAVFGGL